MEYSCGQSFVSMAVLSGFSCLDPRKIRELHNLLNSRPNIKIDYDRGHDFELKPTLAYLTYN